MDHYSQLPGHGKLIEIGRIIDPYQPVVLSQPRCPLGKQILGLGRVLPVGHRGHRNVDLSLDVTVPRIGIGHQGTNPVNTRQSIWNTLSPEERAEYNDTSISASVASNKRFSNSAMLIVPSGPMNRSPLS